MRLFRSCCLFHVGSYSLSEARRNGVLATAHHFIFHANSATVGKLSFTCTAILAKGESVSTSKSVKVSEVICPPVDLEGDAGWIPFDAPSLVGESLRFVSGDPNGNRFRARYYRDDEKH